MKTLWKQVTSQKILQKRNVVSSSVFLNCKQWTVHKQSKQILRKTGEYLTIKQYLKEKKKKNLRKNAYILAGIYNFKQSEDNRLNYSIKI